MTTTSYEFAALAAALVALAFALRSRHRAIVRSRADTLIDRAGAHYASAFGRTLDRCPVAWSLGTRPSPDQLAELGPGQFVFIFPQKIRCALCNRHHGPHLVEPDEVRRVLRTSGYIRPPF